jgi:hypothetical protein
MIWGYDISLPDSYADFAYQDKRREFGPLHWVQWKKRFSVKHTMDD